MLIWFGSEAAEPFRNYAEPGPRGQVIQFMGCGGGRKLVDIWDDRAHDRVRKSWLMREPWP